MEVVVGRIGRPHGIQGEVSVEVRTDEPERRLGPGVTVRTDPRDRRPAHDHRGPGAQRAAAAHASTGSPTAPVPRRCAASCSSPTSTRTSAPRTPRSSTTTSSSASPCTRSTASHVGEIDEVLHLPGQDVLAVDERRRGRADRSAGPVRRRDRPDGRRRRRPGRDRPAARAARRRRPSRPADGRPSGRTDVVRVDVVTIFPDYLAPLDAVADRQGAAPTGCSTCASTTCATGPPTGTARSTTRRTAAEPAW